MIVLRVLTKEEIQKLADKTKALRGNCRHFHYSESDPNGGHPSATRDCSKYKRRYRSTPSDLRRANPDSTVPSISTNGGPSEPRVRDRKRPLPPRRRAWTVDATQGFINIVKQTLIEFSSELIDERYEQEREERRAARRHDRRQRDEYEDEDSADEFKPRAPMLLEAPSTTAGATSSGEQADFVRENRERRREREGEREYSMSGGLGRREDYASER